MLKIGKRFYIGPRAEILMDPAQDPGPEAPDYAKAADGLLAAAGIYCDCVRQTIAPQVVCCHFNLIDPLQISKINKLLPYLEACCHTTIAMRRSECGHFALEFNRTHRGTAHLKNCMLTHTFADSGKSTAILGQQANGTVLALDIAKAPHVLIAGSTGSGKSVLLNSIITSLIFKNTPTTAKLVMIDPKQVELSCYEGLPHMLCPVAKGAAQAVVTLNKVCDVMDARYSKLAKQGKREVDDGYHRIYVVIDELADLMLTSKKQVENLIVRIAQLGRAAGIHLIIATQRPTVNVVTGLIKANIPTRIALTCTSARDSMVILDHKGAEQLAGMGDALLKEAKTTVETRFQSALTTLDDVSAVVGHWTDKQKCIIKR